MSEVRRLVLDVLKPHQPTMLVLADKLGDLEGVVGVDITLIEIDNGYCAEIVKEHGMKRSDYSHRALWEIE